MRRLIDDLREPGARLEMPFWVPAQHEDRWRQHALKLHRMIAQPELPVLLINNVAEYFFTCEQEHWDVKEDFPNLTPPYPSFWVEHEMPKRIHCAEDGDTEVGALVPQGRVGCLITALDPADAVGQGIPEAARWILWCELYLDSGRRDSTAEGPHGSVFVAVDAEGRAIDRPWMQTLARPELDDMMQNIMSMFHPTFLAISLLHCKNVTMIDSRSPAERIKEYRKRHTGLTPAVYKTLIIEPLKQILRSAGGAGEVGRRTTMHLYRCRRGLQTR